MNVTFEKKKNSTFLFKSSGKKEKKISLWHEKPKYNECDDLRDLI